MQIKLDLQLLLEESPGSFLVLAPDTPRFTILAATNAYLRATGTQRSELMGQGLFELLPATPNNPALETGDIRASLERALELQIPDTLTVQRHDVRRPEREGDGFEVEYWSLQNKPVMNDKGEVAYLIHQLEDASKKNAQFQELIRVNDSLEQLVEERTKQLTGALQKLSIILENAPLGILKTIDRKQTWINGKVAELFQYSKEELEGKTTRVLYPSDEAYEKFGSEAYPLLAQGKCYENVKELVRKDGSRVWIRYLGKALAPPDLSQGTLWLVEDITAQRKSEEALRLSEERYRTVVKDQTELIARFHPDGAYTFVNEVFCRFFGKLQGEVLGRSWQPQAVPGELSRIIRELNELSPTNQVVVIENRVYDAGGDIRWMQFVNRGFFDLEGVLLETQAVGRDITALKQSELLLTNLNEQLEQQVTERTEELIVLNTSLIREIEERLDIEQEFHLQQQRLKEMGQELAMTEERERDRIAAQLHDQVSQRLVLARMKVEALSRNPVTPHLERAAEGVCELLDQTIQDTRSLAAQIRPPLLASAGLEAAVAWLGEELHEQYGLRMELRDDHEPKAVEYDIRALIFQAIRELLINVAKHAGISQVQVELRREADHLVITVADAGVGFDPGETRLRKARSGGFGLVHIRQKLEYLGGTLRLESHPGGGTRATIRMPLKVSAAAVDSHERMKILLVDDQSIVREGLRALVELEPDLEVVAEAGSGQSAIDLARELRPHVVIMDLKMPDMNGIEATRAITTELPGVRVVAFSVESDRRFIVEALQAGASGYVLKNSSFTILATAIRTVAGGETYLGPRISEVIIREYLQRVPDFETLCDESLTPREREILQLIAAGKSTKEIAFALEISGKTVDGLRHHLMTKLNLYSTAELTKYAIREGLTSMA